MSETVIGQRKDAAQSRAVRLALILVGVTAVLSLLYAIQYYLGGPTRLAVVTPFTDLAISPDRSLIAAGTKEGQVFAWQVPAELRTSVPADFDVSAEPHWPTQVLRGHRNPLLEVAFAPDEPILLTVDDNRQVRRWQPGGDAGSLGGDVLLSLDDGDLADADLSADLGRLATLDQRGAVRVWDLEQGIEIRQFDAGNGDCRAVALSDDGTLVAAGLGPEILV